MLPGWPSVLLMVPVAVRGSGSMHHGQQNGQYTGIASVGRRLRAQSHLWLVDCTPEQQVAGAWCRPLYHTRSTCCAPIVEKQRAGRCFVEASVDGACHRNVTGSKDFARHGVDVFRSRCPVACGLCTLCSNHSKHAQYVELYRRLTRKHPTLETARISAANATLLQQGERSQDGVILWERQAPSAEPMAPTAPLGRARVDGVPTSAAGDSRSTPLTVASSYSRSPPPLPHSPQHPTSRRPLGRSKMIDFLMSEVDDLKQRLRRAEAETALLKRQIGGRGVSSQVVSSHLPSVAVVAPAVAAAAISVAPGRITSPSLP